MVSKMSGNNHILVKSLRNLTNTKFFANYCLYLQKQNQKNANWNEFKFMLILKYLKEFQICGLNELQKLNNWIRASYPLLPC